MKPEDRVKISLKQHNDGSFQREVNVRISTFVASKWTWPGSSHPVELRKNVNQIRAAAKVSDVKATNSAMTF
jgi:hypothetical protein